MLMETSVDNTMNFALSVCIMKLNIMISMELLAKATNSMPRTNCGFHNFLWLLLSLNV